MLRKQNFQSGGNPVISTFISILKQAKKSKYQWNKLVELRDQNNLGLEMSIDQMLMLPIENIMVPGWNILQYDPVLLTWIEIKNNSAQNPWSYTGGSLDTGNKKNQNYKRFIKPSALESFTLSSFRA